MNPQADVHLFRRLSRQHGAFSRAHALEAGHSEQAIKTRIQRGEWRLLASGVYAHAAYPPTWEQRCHGALFGEPRAVLGGSSGATTYGLLGYNRGRVQLTVPRGSNHRTPLARVRQSDLIEPRTVDGFPVNRLELIFVELAPTSSIDRLDRAFEDAVLRGKTSVQALAEVVDRLRGSRRPGLGRLRAILDLRVDGMVPSESELERRLFALLDDPRIPRVTRQSPFPWCPVGAQRVDAYIAEWGMLLEGDGRLWHARLDTMDDDKRRDQRAAAHGYLPLRFTWRQLTADARAVREDVVAAGRHRAGWNRRAA